jgi:hypothetical protein
VLDEALSIVCLPSARLELAMRVRRGRPSSVRDLLLYAVVMLLHRRSEEAQEQVRQGGRRLTSHDVFPELPIAFDDAVLLAGPTLVGD